MVTEPEAGSSSRDAINETVAKLLRLANEHEDKINIHYGVSLDERIREIIRHYQNVAVNALSGSKTVRDDMLSYFRAMALICEMTLNAGTHAEKAARLRGMVELLESGIEKLQAQQFDLAFSSWRLPDVFRSDYPVRHYLERIHELEAKVKELTPNQEAPGR